MQQGPDNFSAFSLSFYYYAIDLLPGTATPRQCLYSLLAPEKKVMEKYINSSVFAGIICPSSSPARADFFFVDKKDKALRPCINYCWLNEITATLSLVSLLHFNFYKELKFS